MLNTLKQHLLNLPGWHTKRKIVVIQSDDWGSIRMHSEKVRQQLDKHPMIDARGPYCRYDTLASSEDLEALFEVLTSVKDQNGNPAVLTANCLVANPDFDTIRQSNFASYHYETLDKTFERYHNEKALTLWKEGMDQGLFVPQFHGREHVNVPFWLEQLQEGHEGVRRAFDYGVFGVNFKGLPYRKSNFQAAWDFDTIEQAKQINQSIREGLQLFESRFGFRSTTAIAPSYVWSHDQQKELIQVGVKAMQGIPFQYIPNPGRKKYRKRFHYTGTRHLVRNAFFEPSLHPDKDWVSDCLARIGTAFKGKKPAIVSVHRLNFVGKLLYDNRSRNLESILDLLRRIVKRWPDVEFLSSQDILNAVKQ